jgi:glycerol-3-phosphate dehydrogenase subunit B
MADSRFDIAIIGTGAAGLAAAISLSGRGKNTALIGNNLGALAHFCGTLDFCPASRHPQSTAAKLVEQLVECRPLHPYRHIGSPEKILQEFCETSLHDGYSGTTEHPMRFITSAGTMKNAYFADRVISEGDLSQMQSANAVICGFPSKVGLDPDYICDSLKAYQDSRVIDRTTRFTSFTFEKDFDSEAEVAKYYDEHRYELITELLQAAQNSRASVLILPPLFISLDQFLYVKRELGGNKLRVAEIISPGSNLPGHRLCGTLNTTVESLSLTRIKETVSTLQHDVSEWRIICSENRQVFASHVLLAPGNIIGGGIRMSEKRIVSSPVSIPLIKPDGTNFNDIEMPRAGSNPKAGESVFSLGINTQSDFTPMLDNSSCSGLYAAGALLGGFDHDMDECGAGTAIITAIAATRSILDQAK